MQESETRPRGGILAVTYAGTRPAVFLGAVNFVGGWMSDTCPNPTAINSVSFARGGTSPRPTLWLYAENDSFYRLSHSRQNFSAFTAAGGQGHFQVFTPAPGVNSHGLALPAQANLARLEQAGVDVTAQVARGP